MKLVASILSSSIYVQEFLAMQDTSDYYEKAEVVSEIVGKTTYPHINAENIITVTDEGSFYRFKGSISNDAIRRVYNKISKDNMPAYSVIELDDLEYFCFVTPVYKRGSEMKAPTGHIVMLSNLLKFRRTLSKLNTVSGIDTAVIFDDEILLSSNTQLDGSSTDELEELYGSVIISQVTGSDLYVAAAVTKETLNFAENLFVILSAAMTLVLLITFIVLYHTLYYRAISPMFRKTDNMQIGLLKTQINAHFIVNTIDCIESLAEQGEIQKTAKAAKNLSGMLRTLHEADEEINIYDQLEHLNYYTEIMNIRSNNKFIYEIDVDDRLVEYRMPAHILQPIVENALVHGMGNKTDDCRLKITGKIEKPYIIFDIYDNGKGIEANELRWLRERLEKAGGLEHIENSLKGVALVNIQGRIITRYGQGYGLKVNGEVDKGFTVTIHLPMIEDS